jgi:hypothetical protein
VVRDVRVRHHAGRAEFADGDIPLTAHPAQNEAIQASSRLLQVQGDGLLLPKVRLGFFAGCTNAVRGKNT